MPFTDSANNADLYGAINEAGINLIAQHIFRQRPSLFNYGTDFVATHPELLCMPITAAPAVSQRGNPIISVQPPLPVLGTRPEVGLNYCFQISKAEIDFHPGRIALPPELNPPLGVQHFAVHAQICGGLGCPRDFNFPPDPHGREVVPPTDKLDCFCIDLFVVGHAEVEVVNIPSQGTKRFLVGKVDGLEIVDIKPDGLESSMECYLNALIQLVILPQAKVEITTLVTYVLKDIATITLVPTPVSPAIPNNPAIENDQLKMFIKLEVSP
jgi:hypothetical protein